MKSLLVSPRTIYRYKLKLKQMVDQEHKVLMIMLNKRKLQKFLRNKEKTVVKRKNAVEAIDYSYAKLLKMKTMNKFKKPAF